MLEKADITPEIYELTSQKVFENKCSKSGGQKICIFAFLPHILDSSASERNQMIELLQGVAKKHRQHPFVFFWLQGGEQIEVQRAFDIGFGFPQIVTFAPNKKKAAVMRSSWSESNVSSFLTGLMSGKERVFGLEEVKFAKVDKWDGKDAAPPVEEVYDEL
jgi:protein disulfide-isomerase A6